MASEPEKWDGGPDFLPDPRENPLDYIFSKEERTFLNSVDASYAREKLGYINDLFTSDSRNVPNYYGFYDSEIESLVRSVDSVVYDNLGIGEVETTPYIELLLENAIVVSEMNRAKIGLMEGKFLEISSVAHSAFSSDTRNLLSNYMMNYKDLSVLDERRMMAKVLQHIHGDIFDFKGRATKKAHEVRGE